MKKSHYKRLIRGSKIPKGNLIKKELREKGKSKFLGYRKDLQSQFNIEIDPKFKEKEEAIILANRKRRESLKINQEKYPKSYYSDCYINSKEYKER